MDEECAQAHARDGFARIDRIDFAQIDQRLRRHLREACEHRIGAGGVAQRTAGPHVCDGCVEAAHIRARHHRDALRAHDVHDPKRGAGEADHAVDAFVVPRAEKRSNDCAFAMTSDEKRRIGCGLAQARNGGARDDNAFLKMLVRR